MERRARLIRKGEEKDGPVVYWMSRDQRARDNWALLFAQQIALQKKQPLAVLFCRAPYFLNAGLRQYSFMLKGLEKVEKVLLRKNIPFFLLEGLPETEVPGFISRIRSGMLVTDFDPLKIKRKWKEAVIKNISIPVHEVDAHNIVPCWVASPKQEYGAYTFRPKIKRALSGKRIGRKFQENLPLIPKCLKSNGLSQEKMKR
jgi:deoxyribodipyrimidine photo-lyase